MAGEQQAPVALRILRPEDLEILLGLGWRQFYEAGQVLVAAGERVEEIVLVEQGVLEWVGREQGAEQLLRRVEAGGVAGSSALRGSAPAEGTLRAATDVVAVVFRPARVEELQAAHPETASRLGWAIAAALAPPLAGQGPPPPPSRRLGEPIAASSAAGPEQRHLARAGSAVRALDAALRKAAGAPDAGSDPWLEREIPAAARQLDRLVREVGASLAGLADEEQARRFLRLARHELLPLLQRSRLASHMLAREPDEPARFRSLDQIYRGRPSGDDAAGLLLDACLLQRPFAEAVRERRAWLAAEINEEAQRRSAPDRVVRVLTLGSGPARFLADLLERPGMPEMVALTCVDDDREALVHANNLLKARAPQAEIHFRQASPQSLTPETPGYGGYDLVASLFVADTMATEGLKRALATVHGWLRPGGVFLLTALRDDAPDAVATDLLLDWRPARHSRAALEALLAASPFRGGEVEELPAGANLVARAARPA